MAGVLQATGTKTLLVSCPLAYCTVARYKAATALAPPLLKLLLPCCTQDGAGQVLSVCFRLYCQNRGSPKVSSTAAATIRQAVALLFDHVVAEQAVNPAGMAKPEGLASGREMAAMLLLQDLMNMCAGERSLLHGLV